MSSYAWSGTGPPSVTGVSSPLYSGTISDINFSWGSGVVMNSGRSDKVLVKFEGYLTSAVGGAISFRIWRDDGVRLTVGTASVVDNWNVSAPVYSSIGSVTFAANEAKPFVLWYYEDGGGATCKLEWSQGSGAWSVVPSSAFTWATVPGAPVSLTATAGTGQVALAWSVPSSDGGESIDDYGVEFSSDTIKWSTFADGVSANRAATVTGLTGGTGYFFRVRAINGAGSGAYSSVVGPVTPKGNQAITFNLSPSTFAYGDAIPLSATASSGLPVTYTVTPSSVAEVVNSQLVMRGPGTATVTASQAGNAAWNAAANVSRSITVTARALTIGAPSVSLSKAYDRTTTASVTAGALSGVVSGDVVSVTATASYDTAAVGTGKMVTVTYALSGAKAENYTAPASQAFTTGVITARSLGVAGLAAASRTYDGTMAAAVSGTATLTGVVAGDAVTVTGAATGTFADKGVGVGKAVTVSGLSLGGGAASNYALGPITLTADGVPKALTGGAPTLGLAKEYDGTTTASVTAGALSGVVAGDGVSVTASAGFDKAGVGSGKTVTVTYALGGVDAGNYTGPTAETFPTGVITAKALGVSGLAATSRAYDGTTAVAVTGTPVLTGLVAGDDVAVTGAATGVLADKNVGVGKSVTALGLSLGGTAAGNYALGVPTLAADVTPKGLTVGAPTLGLAKEYDGTTTASVTAGALSGVVAGDGVSVTASAGFDTAGVGSGKTVTVTYALGGLDAGNYTGPTSETFATGVITAKGLGVSGLAVTSRAYDGTTVAAVSGTATLTGVVLGDVVTVSGAVTGTFADQGVGVGKPVTVSGFVLGGSEAANYALGSISLTANITPKPLPVSGVVALDKVFDGTASASLDLSGATLVGVVAGDDVQLDVSQALGWFGSEGPGIGKPVTVVGLGVFGASAGNYTVQQPTGMMASITVHGVLATAYGFGNEFPPATPATGPMLRRGVVPQVVFDWGGGAVLGTDRSDAVLVKFEGTISVPMDGDVTFAGVSDDGMSMEVDGVELFRDWGIHGPTWTPPGTVMFQANQPRSFEVWFYENGGGAVCELWWNFGGEWQPVPSWAFTAGGKPPNVIDPFDLVGPQVFIPGIAVPVTVPWASSDLPVSVTVKSGPATLVNGRVVLTGIGTVVLAANQAGDATFDPAAEVTTSFESVPLVGGGLLREMYEGVDGGSVSDLVTHPSFPDHPTWLGVHTGFFEVPDYSDSYGQRFRGTFIPPVSGPYTFWIASDDGSELYVSTDDGPANKRLIAGVNAWTGFRAWGWEASQQSQPVELDSTKAYYIEVLHKEGGGGDHVSVRWTRPDGVDEEPIPLDRFLPWGLKRPQSITFGPPQELAYGDAVQLGATATSGRPVVYEVEPAGAADVVQGRLVIRRVGSISITAREGGSDAWEPAAPVSRVIQASPRALTGGAPSVELARDYDGTTTASVKPGALVGVVAGDAVTVTANAGFDTAGVGTGKTVTVTYALGGTDAGNYTGPTSETFAGGVITAKGLGVSGLAATSRAYDGTMAVAVTGTP
ncbi:MAG: YDG domain-containing protein, partial [Verrucomicrobiota bacterium]